MIGSINQSAQKANFSVTLALDHLLYVYLYLRKNGLRDYERIFIPTISCASIES